MHKQLGLFVGATTEKPLDELISDNYMCNAKNRVVFTEVIQQKVTTAYNYLQQIVNDLNDNELSTTPLNADMMQPRKNQRN